MKAFRTNINNTRKVKIGKKGDGSGGGPGGPPPKNIKIESDDEDDGDDGDDQDSKDGEGNKPQPGSIPTVNDKGGAKPIIDVVPDDTTFDEMFDSPEELPGSEGKDGEGGKPVMKREELKKAIDQANKDQEAAIRQSQIGRGQGRGGKRIGVPGDFPTKTDWVNILKQFLSKYQPGRPSFNDIHKRTFGMKVGGTPITIAGRGKEQTIGKLIVAIDTSGSISDAIMNGFLSELKKIFLAFSNSKTFAVKLILWADGPYADSPDFNAKEFNRLADWANKNFVSGGTAMDPVIRYMNQRYEGDYVGVVWFTDGQVERLKTKLMNAFHVAVINGFSTDLVKGFMQDMKRLKPVGKEIVFLGTNYTD